ncbi:UDP-N-acetylglucosamine--LPS N-acetylglucosamine transferase [bacterium]|nr:UDP-N-acetylglucosamine--LPS N-acetylglucosamine transferase [bacterium]
MSFKRPIHLLLVSSTGGHLKQLYELKNFWERYERTWVTFNIANGSSLLKDEKQVVWANYPTNFPNLPNNVKNTFLALKMLLSGKYTHVISTGAGVGVPYIWLGWLLSPFLKTKTIFIDSLTRTSGISFSMKLVYFFSHIRLTQWPENTRKYTRLLYKGKVL